MKMTLSSTALLTTTLFLVGTALLLLLQTANSSPRVITLEELKMANGKDSDKIWLSMAGKVYDVSKGKDYYGPGGSYHIFAGHDALAPFVTGIFTEEEAAKTWRDIPSKNLAELNHWLGFYEKEEAKYPFVGVLHGAFYDENGSMTAENYQFHAAVQLAGQQKKREMDERKNKKQQEKQQQEEEKQQQEKKTEL